MVVVVLAARDVVRSSKTYITLPQKLMGSLLGKYSGELLGTLDPENSWGKDHLLRLYKYVVPGFERVVESGRVASLYPVYLLYVPPEG